MVPGSRAKITRPPLLFTAKGLREAGSTTVHSDGQGGGVLSGPNSVREFQEPVWSAPRPSHTLQLSLPQSLRHPFLLDLRQDGLL